MGNVAVNGLQNKNNTMNFFDTSFIKQGTTLESIKKESKSHSLFLAVDKNKDGKIDAKEFKSFQNMDEKEISKIIVISPIIEVKRILKANELTKKLLKKEIKAKKAKIKMLLAKKKTTTWKQILLGLGGGTIVGTAVKFIFGTSIIVAGGISAMGLLAILMSNYLHNRRIDNQIANLKADILLLKSAYALIP